MSPTVSVIIPTTRRPDLVQRALRSVMAQTLTNIEIIIVVEGPNPETLAVLAAFDEPRLRILQNPTPLGAGAARNLAAAQARGDFLAFLDDDDSWLPEKLERQVRAAATERVLVSCRSRVVTPHGVSIWPRRLYDSATPVDEYLFDRQRLFRGDSHIGTSSYLLRRTLFLETGFSTDRQNEDTSLLLRLTKQAGARIVMLPETLVVLYKEEARESLGSHFDWREMHAWADAMGNLLTPRAYSGFCLIYLGSQAASQRDMAGFATLLRCAFLKGAPRLIHVALFAGFWLLPLSVRRRLRALAGRAFHRPRL